MCNPEVVELRDMGRDAREARALAHSAGIEERRWSHPFAHSVHVVSTACGLQRRERNRYAGW